MIEVGFLGKMSIISLSNRDDVYYLYSELLSKSNKELLSYDEWCILNKIFKKYLNYQESLYAIEFLHILHNENQLNLSKKSMDLINDVVSILKKLSEQLHYLKEHYNENGVIRMIIFNIPYCMLDKMQPLEFYDNLTDEDEPFWMRDVSDFIQK